MGKSAPSGKEKGGKSSALKRLKASLKEAGVIGPGGRNRGSQTKKQRQSSNTLEAGKNKKGEKLSLIKDAFNPFEIKTSKNKYEIIGRSVKGVSGRPTLSKQVGIDNRKKTLLKEYNDKNRTGTIIDRRFGENDATMTPEEKMLERYTKEKQKKVRNSSVFNLEDDTELQLTHMGQSLAEIDDFDEPIPSDEDDTGGIDRYTVHNAHFGGFDPEKSEQNDGRPKSKAEVMKEVIAKSKFYKHEKQKLKEDDEKIRQELDNELDDIKSLLFSAQPSESIVKRKPLESQNSMFKKTSIFSKNENDTFDENRPEDYDKFVRELAYDQKAQATDRTKTEEEVALEEKTKLEKAERHRLRRMQGLDSESEDEGTNSRKKSRRAGQGDDLDDDFITEEDATFGLGEGVKIREINPSQKGEEDENDNEEEIGDEEEDEEEDEGEDEEGDDEESNDEDSEEDEDEDEDEDEGSDIESDVEDDQPINNDDQIKKKHKIDPKSSEEAAKELPYTFPLPQEHESLINLVGKRDVKDHAAFLKRARVLYHPKLGVENKEKMEAFLLVVLEHLVYLGDDEESLNKELINVYMKNFVELAIIIPDIASKVSIRFLNEVHEEFKDQLTQSTRNPSTPSPGQLLVFSVFTQLFSVSDFYHAVISPMLLLFGQMLLQVDILSPICLAKSLYIVGLFYEIASSSKRFVPEALGCLYTILAFVAPEDTRKSIEAMNDVFFNRFQIENNNLYKKLNKITKEVYSKFSFSDGDKEALKYKLKFSELSLDTKDPLVYSTEFITTLLVVTLRNVKKFADLNGHHSGPLAGFPEAFESFIKIISKFEESTQVSDDLKSLIKDHKEHVQTYITRCLSSRRPLQLQNHKALAIKTLLPKFEAEYSLDKHYLPEDENKELTKLRRQHKREFKGAIRELRKDTQFLAREKLKNIKEKDAAYKEKIKGIMGELANNQGDEHKFNYEKKYKRGK